MNKSIAVGLIFFSTSLHAQITKIEHFYASSPKAEALFDLFKNTLGLPVVWDFQTWGDFSSGGLSLGNVAFELVSYEGVGKTKFEGIALEPRQHAEEFTEILDNAGVMHDTIVPNTYVMPNGTVAGWSTMTINNALPDESGFFICDYKNRDKVLQNRKQSSDTLTMIHGGPLGIVLLKEIVVGSTNFLFHTRELAKLPGVAVQNDNLFTFEEGPALRLARSDTNGTQKIIMQVHSIDKAREYLKSKGLLGTSSATSVLINPQSTDGLIIELTGVR